MTEECSMITGSSRTAEDGVRLGWVIRRQAEKKRTAEVVVALRTRRTEGIRVCCEALPLLRVILVCLHRREPIPHPWVDPAHLRLLDDLYGELPVRQSGRGRLSQRRRVLSDGWGW
jgi:hypothetical protein